MATRRSQQGKGQRGRGRKRHRPVREEIELGPPASEYREPVKGMHGVRLWIHGAPKVGKTTFFSEAPNHYLFRVEEGAAFVRHRGNSIRSWPEFLARVEQFAELLESPTTQKKYRTFGIDTVDKLYEYCEAWVCEQRGIEDPGEEGYAKGWKACRQEFFRGIAALCVLPISKERKVNVVFLSHSEDREVQVNRHLKLNVQQATLAKTGRRILEPLVEVIAFMRPHEEKDDRRVMEFRGSESLQAGDRSKRLPKRMTFKEGAGWKKFVSYINGERQKGG